MANDRLYIRCQCGKDPAMLAKIWAGRIGVATEAWPQATRNLDLFFSRHAGCRVEGFSLCFELEAEGIAPTPPAADGAPPTSPSHPSR